MSADIVIEKYANALFETIAAAGNMATATAELEAVAKTFGDPNAVEFFSSPFNSADQKLSVARSSLEGKVSTELFNFVSTLVKNERSHLISEINLVFKTKASQIGGQAEGKLFVVDQPSVEFKASLEKKVSNLLKREVRLTVETDKTLISGFKVQVEGWTLDDSALHHLKKLTENISTKGL